MAFWNSTRGAAINDQGTVGFMADLDLGGFGIFIGPDSILDAVIQTGDPLFGSTVTDLYFNRGLNNNSQLSYFALLSDGRQVIARADPFQSPTIPEPTTIAIFTLGLLGLGVARRRRKAA